MSDANTKEKRFTRAWAVIQMNGKAGDVYPYWRGGCKSSEAKRYAKESCYDHLGERVAKVKIYVER